MTELKYPCPICGYLRFCDPPGSYDICDFCSWEDDSTQLSYPMWAIGANGISLYEYQQQWLARKDAYFADCHPDDRPTEADVQDPGWRPFDPTRDKFLVHDDTTKSKEAQWWWRESRYWSQENRGDYWWRDDYWLKDAK